LWDVSNYALKGFKDMGFDIGRAETPIIPLYIGEQMKALQLTKMLLDEGIFVNPVVSPAVKETDCMIRFSLMATHTKEQVQIGLEKIYKCAKALDIVPELISKNH
jgi:8-amino-7-oxononanoate synthase